VLIGAGMSGSEGASNQIQEGTELHVSFFHFAPQGFQIQPPLYELLLRKIFNPKT
jgi:hypothetical protein